MQMNNLKYSFGSCFMYSKHDGSLTTYSNTCAVKRKPSL